MINITDNPAAIMVYMASTLLEKNQNHCENKNEFVPK